jgi:hypothetical protein
MMIHTTSEARSQLSLLGSRIGNWDPPLEVFRFGRSHSKEMASPTPNLALPQLRIYILETSWRRVSHHVGPRK